MHDGEDDGDALVSSEAELLSDPGVPMVKPRRILDRSESIARREDELSRALVVTVLGGEATAIVILQAIAHRF